jgi:iron complex transport system substrate-binding protein
LDGLFEAIRQVASAVGVSADDIIRELRGRVEAVAARSATVTNRPRVALLEWLDPPFSSGHWNPELVRLAGGIEGLGREGRPSCRLRWDEVLAWQPEVIMIACCGFDVERTLKDVAAVQSIAGWQELPAVRSGRVYVADGSQYFNRPGPRLVDSLELLAHALSPTRHPLPNGLSALDRVSGLNWA